MVREVAEAIMISVFLLIYQLIVAVNNMGYSRDRLAAQGCRHRHSMGHTNHRAHHTTALRTLPGIPRAFFSAPLWPPACLGRH